MSHLLSVLAQIYLTSCLSETGVPLTSSYVSNIDLSIPLTPSYVINADIDLPHMSSVPNTDPSLPHMSSAIHADVSLIVKIDHYDQPSAAVFLAFDENCDNHIDFKEMACGISACCRGPSLERQKCTFCAVVVFLIFCDVFSFLL